MTGDSRGDFTRLRFDPRRHYSGVRMQQGRVQLDADWNEQVDVVAHRIRTGTFDLVGPSGAPAAAAGFAVSPGPLGLELGAGGHFVLVGGTRGFRLPDGVGPGEDLELSLEVLPRHDGVVASLWQRGGEGGSFHLAWGLQMERGRLRLRRGDLDDLLSPRLPRLAGHLRRLTVRTGPRGAAVLVDGRTVVSDGTGWRLPDAPLLLLLGSRKAPRFEGLLGTVTLATTGAESRELGEWRCGETADDEGGGSGGGDRIRGRGPLDVDAAIRGDGEAAARRLPLDLALGAGRYYVEGVLCENPAPASVRRQADLPGAELPQPAGLEREDHVLYLDVWEHTVGPAEDPDHLLEPALGGADTAVRSRVVAQLRSLPLARLGSEVEPEATAVHDAWTPPWPPLEERGRLTARCRQPGTTALDNVLYRVEVHDAGDGATADVAEHDPEARRLTLAGWDDGWRPGRVVVIEEQRTVPRPGVAVRVAAVEAGDNVLVLAGGGELPGSGPLRVRRAATFKWARHNASRVFRVTELDVSGETGALLATLDAASRGVEALAAAGWVELEDDRTALGAAAPVLHRVRRVDPDGPKVYLEPAAGAGNTASGPNPRLRLWDQGAGVDGGGGVEGGAVTPWGAVVARPEVWIELEDGVQVRFAGDAAYRSGDYWTLPVRTATADVDWPRDDHGLPAPAPPHGVEHRSAPVALLTYDAAGFRLADLRRTFHPHSVGAVRKAGDWMDGPLEVRADVTVAGDVEVGGDVRGASLHGRVVSPGAVGETQIAAGAVSRRTLAPDVGVVPDRHCVLGPAPEPPPGYVASGWMVPARRHAPRWSDRREMPATATGGLANVALGGRVYTLLESGEVWEYDPAADVWQRRQGLPLVLRDFAAAVLGERIFVAGGTDDRGRPSSRLIEYDPRAGTWAECSDLPVARSALALVACEGRLHALGGLYRTWFGLGRASARHDVYDPVTDTWSAAPALPERLVAPGAAAIEERLHVVGGERRWLFGLWGRRLTADHHVYHDGVERWLRDAASLPTRRRHVRLVEIDGQLAAVGGESAVNWLDEVDLFDPSAGAWRALPPLHERIEAPGVTALRGTLYVTGARRAAGSAGVLMETCPVATRFYVHCREGVEGGETVVEEPAEPDESHVLPRLEDEAGSL